MNILKPKILTKEVLKVIDEFACDLHFDVCESKEDWHQVLDLFQYNFPKSVEVPVIYASPQSLVLVAKRNTEVIGSISLVQAGIMPLPNASSINLNLISSYRNRLIEITDLSISAGEKDPDFLRTLLIKYALHFIANAFTIERFIFTDIDCKNTKLLEELALGCLNKNFPKSYQHRLGHEACFYYGSYESISHKLETSGLSDNAALYKFLTDLDTCHFNLPNRLFQRSNLLPMKPEVFTELFPKDRLETLEQKDLRNLKNCFLQSPKHLELLPECSLPTLRTEIRHPVRCDAIEIDERGSPVPSTELTIVSVANRGVAFLTDDFKPKKGSIVKMRVEVGHNILSDIQIKIGNSYNGMITGRIIQKDHYWGRFQNFLCKSFN